MSDSFTAGGPIPGWAGDLIGPEITEDDRLPNSWITRDSGQREDFPSGSRRDIRRGKGRYDLISPIAIRRLAELLERGAEKYGPRNWEKGQPLSRYLDSALRHLYQVVEGYDDEDHAAAVLFNVAAYMHTLDKVQRGELPAELDDRGDL